MSGNEIRIEKLELRARIGITPEERAQPQRLTVSLVMVCRSGFGSLADRIENAVDYFAVCQAVERLAAARERNLIETLAEEIAALVLRDFACLHVTVELRKYILANTDFVAARITRSADQPAA